jgi:hypothetical protein
MTIDNVTPLQNKNWGMGYHTPILRQLIGR